MGFNNGIALESSNIDNQVVNTSLNILSDAYFFDNTKAVFLRDVEL